MTSKFEKALKISSDMLSYCFHRGATKYHLDILEEPDSITLAILASGVDISVEEYEDLKRRIHAPRQKEIEQDYWELIGESEDFSEITLVGMLCDEAIVNYSDNTLNITLKRYDQ